ncbi:ProQ/FINO family protein [Pokkaliibacter sp. CJK22405]|uniref:ProQ/FINO family protein n=1 Tax=Pokkaliibacter sp. CJK22405 TaxID=3384615 RepID=UPI0039853C3F
MAGQQSAPTSLNEVLTRLEHQFDEQQDRMVAETEKRQALEAELASLREALAEKQRLLDDAHEALSQMIQNKGATTVSEAGDHLSADDLMDQAIEQSFSEAQRASTETLPYQWSMVDAESTETGEDDHSVLPESGDSEPNNIDSAGPSVDALPFGVTEQTAFADEEPVNNSETEQLQDNLHWSEPTDIEPSAETLQSPDVYDSPSDDEAHFELTPPPMTDTTSTPAQADQNSEQAQNSDNKKARNKRKNQAANRAAVQWLMDEFPLTFSRENPRPLKIGIQENLMERKPDAAGKIKRGLASYTRSPYYLKSFKAGVERVDLDGQDAGAISEQDAQYAAGQFEKYYGKAPAPAGKKAPRKEKEQRPKRPSAEERQAKADQRMENKLHQLLEKHQS